MAYELNASSCDPLNAEPFLYFSVEWLTDRSHRSLRLKS